MREKYDYFFSYSRKINYITLKLIKVLDGYSIRIWVDRTDVSLGCNIYTNIDNVLKDVRNWMGAIVIFDKTYFQKDWCLKELNSFINNEVPILPILHGITKDEIPPEYKVLKKLNYLRYNNEDDIKPIINGILLSHINNYKYRCHTINIHLDIINALMQRILYKKANVYHAIIDYSNLAKCLQIQLKQCRFMIDAFDKTLFSIIEDKVSDVYKDVTLSRNDYILARKALICLLKRFNIISNIVDNSEN